MNKINSGMHYLLSLSAVKDIEIHWELVAVFAYCFLVYLILKTFQYNKDRYEK